MLRKFLEAGPSTRCATAWQKRDPINSNFAI
jgi:hypothetical protein